MSVGEETMEARQSGAKILGSVEADMFCSGCHYNLHGLDVRVDERLDIPVVRCPECGKFHAAGIATGAGRAWLHRLTRFLISFWVLAVIGVIAGSGLLMFILDAIHFDVFTRYDERAFVGAGRVWFRRPVTPADFGSFTMFFLAHAFFTTLCVAAGWILGMFLSVFLWQVRRIRHLWAAVLPLVAGTLCLVMLRADRPSTKAEIWSWMISSTLLLTLWMLLGLALGIFAGRMVARFLCRGILTRRLLQHVRFLWEVDGMVAPPLNPK